MGLLKAALKIAGRLETGTAASECAGKYKRTLTSEMWCKRLQAKAIYSDHDVGKCQPRRVVE